MQGFNTNQYPTHLLMQLSQLFPASGPQEIQYMAKALYSQNQERSQVNPTSPMGLEFNYSAPSTQYNQAYSFNCLSPFAYERNGNLSNISTSPSMSSMIGEKKEVFEDEYSSDFTHAFEYSNTPINQQFEDDQTEQDSEKLLTTSKKINKDKSFSQSRKPKDQQFRSRRGLWSEEDDAQLRELVAEHGQKWSLIGSIMGDRKGKQVRDRYMNTSRPDINHSQWTEEEDELFLTLFDKYGNKWCQIAAEMPGRTENQVKNKFYCLKRSNKVKKSSKKTAAKAKKGKTIDQVSASTSENYSPIKQTEAKDTSLFKDIDCFFDFTGEESNSCEFAPASNYNNNKGSIWAMI